MASKSLLLASITAISALSLACKPKAGATSEANDFAYRADATGAAGSANFFVFAGHKPNDPTGVEIDGRRWSNMIAGGALGRFAITLEKPAATLTDIRNAFAQMAPKLTPSSTVAFIYTGGRAGDQLTAAEGQTAKTFTLSDVMAPILGGAKYARLILIYDTESASRDGVDSTWLLDNAATVKAAFNEVIEVSAASAASTAVSGTFQRLSMGFTSVLAETGSRYMSSRASDANNPTLAAFFSAVAAQDQTGRTRSRTIPEALAAQVKMFNSSTFPDPTRGQGPGRLDRLDQIALTSEQGSRISFGQLRSEAEIVLLEFSTPWCGPCAQAALSIAADPAAQAAFGTGRCKLITTILSEDGQGVGGVPAMQAMLGNWRNQLNQKAAASGGLLSPALVGVAMGHSFATEFSGAAINGADRYGNPRPPGFLDPGLQIDSFPKFIAFNAATGEILSVGAAGDYRNPMAAMTRACSSL